MPPTAASGWSPPGDAERAHVGQLRRVLIGIRDSVAGVADDEGQRVPGEEPDQSSHRAADDADPPPTEHDVDDQPDGAADRGHEQRQTDNRCGFCLLRKTIRWNDTEAMSNIVASAAPRRATV
jgi:hypothetical protein